MFGLLIAVYVHQTKDPNVRSFPNIQVINGKDGKDGKTPQIDYSKIDAYIQKQIATIPTPVNGINGVNGKTGATGAQGQTGQTGPQGPSGSQGNPGAVGRPIVIWHNDAKAETDWQYLGDLSWKLLVKDCQITNTCEAQ